jgi:hypothetical protein
MGLCDSPAYQHLCCNEQKPPTKGMCVTNRLQTKHTGQLQALPVHGQSSAPADSGRVLWFNKKADTKASAASQVQKKMFDSGPAACL